MESKINKYYIVARVTASIEVLFALKEKKGWKNFNISEKHCFFFFLERIERLSLSSQNKKKRIPSPYTKQHFHCRHNLCIYIYINVYSLLLCIPAATQTTPHKQNGNAHLPSSNVSPGTSASRVSTGATANRIVRIRATKIALTKPLHTPLHLSVRSVFTLFIYFFFPFFFFLSLFTNLLDQWSNNGIN